MLLNFSLLDIFGQLLMIIPLTLVLKRVLSFLNVMPALPVAVMREIGVMGKYLKTTPMMAVKQGLLCLQFVLLLVQIPQLL